MYNGLQPKLRSSGLFRTMSYSRIPDGSIMWCIQQQLFQATDPEISGPYMTIFLTLRAQDGGGDDNVHLSDNPYVMSRATALRLQCGLDYEVPLPFDIKP